MALGRRNASLTPRAKFYRDMGCLLRAGFSYSELPRLDLETVQAVVTIQTLKESEEKNQQDVQIRLLKAIGGIK
jgi:hypothetical protein